MTVSGNVSADGLAIFAGAAMMAAGLGFLGWQILALRRDIQPTVHTANAASNFIQGLT